MRELPILFSGAMVRALLDDSKTQTRRIVMPQPVFGDVAGTFASWMFKKRRGAGHWLYPNARETILAECPYGRPGDRLWVRETWSANLPEVRYQADKTEKYFPDDHPSYADLRRMYDRQRGDWRPNIHMPRWACRILLDITDVRVERLQEITSADAIAEGVLPPGMEVVMGRPVDGYRNLWNGLNAKRNFGWDANPWVWVVSFKRVAP